MQTAFHTSAENVRILPLDISEKKNCLKLNENTFSESLVKTNEEWNVHKSKYGDYWIIKEFITLCAQHLTNVKSL